MRRVFLYLTIALIFFSFDARAHSVEAVDVVPIGHEFCALFGAKGATPATLIQNTSRFKCGQRHLNETGDYLWLYADLSDIAANVEAPVLRATMSRHGGVQTYAVYADGSTSEKIYPIGKLRDQWRSEDSMGFPLASKSGAPLTQLLIGVDTPWDAENWGTLDLLSAERDLQYHISGMAYSSLFIGLLLGPVLISLLFFIVLRARFIAFHFTMVFAAFLYGLSWSGILFSLFPWLDVPTRSTFNHIVIPLAFMFGCLFTRELCEKEKLPAFWRTSLSVVGVIPVVTAPIAMTFGAGAPQFSFAIISFTLLIVPIVLLSCLVVASVKGSVVARLQLLGWSGVSMIILGNIAHDIGFIDENVLLVHGLFPALLFEALVTSSLVAYRFVKLRREMDQTASERVLLEKAATTDFLTDLPNRSRFIQHFEQMITAGAHRSEHVALICIDIDNFKRINDMHGHAIGDKALIEMAKILKDVTAQQGFPARFGGEEFSILTAAASKEDLYYRAERLRYIIAEHMFEDVGTVTVSVGIVHICPENTVNFDAYYGAADAALYAAKAAGRNQVRLSGWKPDAPQDDAEDAAYAQDWKLAAT
jgi:diguanylate cyclase (GGDEF)-like protein